jgi:hypothetical protein
LPDIPFMPDPMVRVSSHSTTTSLSKNKKFIDDHK